MTEREKAIKMIMDDLTHDEAIEVLNALIEGFDVGEIETLTIKMIEILKRQTIDETRVSMETLYDAIERNESDDEERDQFRDDVEADADVLRTAGFGTEEDYRPGGCEDY